MASTKEKYVFIGMVVLTLVVYRKSIYNMLKWVPQLITSSSVNKVDNSKESKESKDINPRVNDFRVTDSKENKDTNLRVNDFKENKESGENKADNSKESKDINSRVNDSEADKNNSNLLGKMARFADKCPLCTESGIAANHSFRTCAKFSILKRGTSTKMYHDLKLLPVDETGFCTAAILPVCEVDEVKYVLLTKEERTTKNGSQTLLNFAGGKRDCLSAWKEVDPYDMSFTGFNTYDKFILTYRFETSRETAASEFMEEVGPLLGGEDYPYMNYYLTTQLQNKTLTVVWVPNSKAALYIVELPEVCMTYPCIAKPQSEEAISFEWVALSDFDLELAHEFVRPTLEYVRKILCS
jgi:hypothetical protein